MKKTESQYVSVLTLLLLSLLWPAGLLAQPAGDAKNMAAPIATLRTVSAGDTLGKIAKEVKTTGVTLEQVLLGLYRANPEAFLGQNMNRLKAGARLAMPAAAEFEAIPAEEARKLLAETAAKELKGEEGEKLMKAFQDEAEAAEAGMGACAVAEGAKCTLPLR